MKVNGRKIKQLREARGWSQAEIAKRLQVHKQTISNVEQGLSPLGDARLKRLAELLGATLSDLASPVESVSSMGDVMLFWTPVYGTVPADRFYLSFDVGPDESIPVVGKKQDALFALRILGQSMAPKLQDGDHAIFVKQSQANAGEVVVARVDDAYTIKRYQPRTSETEELTSDNPAHGKISTPMAAVTIIGKLYGIYRRP